MNKTSLIVIIGIVIAGMIAAGYFLLLKPKCPASCDDGNTCTNDICSKETKNKCKAVIIPDCCSNKTCEPGVGGL